MGVSTAKSKAVDRSTSEAGTGPWLGCSRKLVTRFVITCSKGIESYVLETKKNNTFNFRKSESMFLFSSLKSAIGGMIPLSRINMVLITLAMPAAPSRCPIFAFKAPLLKFVRGAN